MPRGGARPGAGRKPKATPAAACPPVTKNGIKEDPKWPFGRMEKPAEPAAPPAVEQSPLDYLLEVMRDSEVDPRVRLQAASLAAPLCHAKKGEAGKKEEKDAAAKKAHSRFAPAAPPKLVAAGGKKV